MKRDPKFKHIINRLEKDKGPTNININQFESQYSGDTAYWRDAPLKIVDNNLRETGDKVSPELALGHELVHAYIDRYYNESHKPPKKFHWTDPDALYDDEEEEFVIKHYEAPYGRQFGDGVRGNHKGDY
ncbi:MAG: hypothetical protein H8F28_06320 [Fibrella sp.]|nr:hypothetical protein [Armatimonadota bacterium]